MFKFQAKKRKKSGFTIVELLIVIAVIGILATITVIGYGSWRHSTLSAAVKSDLSGVISAMEDYRTFNNGYPTTLPTTFTPSNGTALTIDPSSSTTAYCINGASNDDASIKFYVTSTKKAQGAIEGTCADLNNGTLPGVPVNLASTAVGGITISLSWNAGAGGTVATYTAQCASDTAYIQNFGYITVSSTSGTVSGLAGSSTYYCRILATNASGSSPWSDSITVNTNANGCSDTGQYGTYPACYPYNSLPIATSIEGYWTSAPQGFLLEDGSAVSRTTYSDLFAAIGTTYGAGNGSTTFNLPDSRGRVAVNLSPSDAEFNTMGEKYGEKAHTISIAEMPSHTHIQDPHNHIQDPHNHTQNAHSHAPGWGSQFSTFGSGSGRQTLNSGGSWWVLTSTDLADVSSAATTADTTATNNATTATNNATTATNQYTGGGGAHNTIQPSIVKMFVIKYTPVVAVSDNIAKATSIEGYWTSAPQGFLLEDGLAVSRTTYAGLFAVIGTTYGAGNGSTTFNLPDSRGRVAVNLSSSDAEFNTMGEKYGEKAHILSIAEMPSHTHIQDPHNHTQNAHNHTQNPHNHAPSGMPYFSAFNSGVNLSRQTLSSGGSWWVLTSTNLADISSTSATASTTATNNATTATNQATTATNQYTGGGLAHNNIQPSIVKMFAIKY